MTSPSGVRKLRRRVGARVVLAVGGSTVLLLSALTMALAVHDEDFQLDGDTSQLPANSDEPYDWESFFNDPNPGTTDPTPATKGADAVQESIPANSGFTDVDFEEDWRLVNGVYQTSDPTTFTQSHDYEQIGGTGGWRCKTANQVTNKGDITNNYVAVYEKNGKKILYFGLEKDQDSGSNNVGVWFLQDGTVGCAGGGTGNGNAFTGAHQAGDIFLVSEFTNGGGVSLIKGYVWRNDIDAGKAGNQPGLDPNPFAASADCVLSVEDPDYDDRLCATSNRDSFSPQWTHWNFDLGANAGLKPATFIEGAISVGEFPDFANACFNKFLFNTRSSPELTATLYDYSLGSIGTCDGNITITPDDINEAGPAAVSSHTFTITATALTSAVPTSIAITPSVSPTPTTQSNTCASPTLSNGGKTATCTLTISSTQVGTFTANASVVFSYQGGTTVTRDTDPATTNPAGGGGSGPAVKQFVGGTVGIAPSEINEVGDSHVFTITATATGNVAPTAITLTPNVTPDPTAGGNGTYDTTCGTADQTLSSDGKTATCTVTITSDVVGTFTATATAKFTYSNGLEVTRTTNGQAGNSGAAVKDFVDAKITITPDDINEAGPPAVSSHTFTITVTATGAPTPASISVTPSFSAQPSTLTNNCSTPSTNTKTKTCTVVISSTQVGTITANATASIVYTNGPTLTRDTNPATTDILAGPGGSGPAVKEFVGGSITVDPDDTNNIGESHVFTVVATATGNVAPTSIAIAHTVTPDVTAGGNGTKSSTCASPTLSNGGKTATCTITITSNVAGTFTANATATFTYSNNLVVTRSTDGTGANSDGAVKVFVSGTLRWLKHDAAGALLAGATFEVCRTHTFVSATATFSDTPNACVTVPDRDDAADVTPDVDVTGGEFQLNGLVLGRYTITETVPPPGYHKDDSVETVELTIANPSNADNTTGDVVPIFVNLKAFRMIVLTCDDITNELVVSRVDFDGNLATTTDQKDTIGDLSAALTGKGLTDADICGTDSGPNANPAGIGGASYGDLNDGTYNPKVTIPK